MPAPRKQAHRLTEWLKREHPSLRAVLLGARREGKSDLLAQTHQLLFDSADGPLPFWFRFDPAPGNDDSAQGSQAMRFAAAFCQQIRAFLLRQGELLSEAPGELAGELERPGVPLALSELAREILSATQSSAPGSMLVSLAARLPARFAHREGRPVCHLWDDCHLVASDSAYIKALDAAGGVGNQISPISSLLTGHAPQMRQLLGQRNLTALNLEPFAASEALLMAESSCKAAGLRFNREVWECWFSVAGTSPGWMTPLVDAAGLRGEPIESVEQLGRLYAGEVESGSLGSWLAERWPLPTAASSADELAPRAIASLLASRAAESLTIANQPSSASKTQNASNVASLHHSEWLRLYPFTSEHTLSMPEADWLRIETDRATMGSARAKARLLQDFLLRIRTRELSQQTTDELSLDAIEEHLLYPASPGTAINSVSGDELRLPEISSVVRESTPEGELYWNFGEAQAKPARKTGAARQSTKTQASPNQTFPIVLLIVHAETNPTKALVAEWTRRLQQELSRPNEPVGALRTELWVVVPPGGSLAPLGGEKRLSREMLSDLLTAVDTESAHMPHSASPTSDAVPPAGGEALVEEIGRRLAELQARAQVLQQEFRSGQKSPTPAAALPARPSTATASSASQSDRRAEYLRQALSLSLMLASADLAATGSPTESQRSLADLQLQCQQVLAQLHAQADHVDPPPGKVKAFPPTRS